MLLASTHLVSGELSWANLAAAGNIRSAISFVPDKTRSGSINSTTSDKCWAAHLLTAMCKWLEETCSITIELIETIFQRYTLKVKWLLLSLSHHRCRPKWQIIYISYPFQEVKNKIYNHWHLFSSKSMRVSNLLKSHYCLLYA